jgi:hypothetical protein
MSRVAPPEKKWAGRSCRVSGQARGTKINGLEIIAGRDSVQAPRWRLLLERYATELLEPFRCHRCGVWSLDPCGREGKSRQWLCEECADGGRPS